MKEIAYPSQRNNRRVVLLHIILCGGLIKTLKEDKHEIFRAAHDASKATDYLLVLERDRSLADEALPGGAESLKAAHAITTQRMGESARTAPALTDSGTYRGVIIGESATHILQRQTAQAAVAHPKQLLDRQPRIGENVAINYSGGKATVRETRERAKDKGLGR